MAFGTRLVAAKIRWGNAGGECGWGKREGNCSAVALRSGDPTSALAQGGPAGQAQGADMARPTMRWRLKDLCTG
ncbi:hypothetical protein acdb102_21780 [Acidothermaceae bacterium B102]|nr:hypothetical protein acdb102_21780 [Acidothermaceae bacterium B102]